MSNIANVIVDNWHETKNSANSLVKTFTYVMNEEIDGIWQVFQESKNLVNGSDVDYKKIAEGANTTLDLLALLSSNSKKIDTLIHGYSIILSFAFITGSLHKMNKTQLLEIPFSKILNQENKEVDVNVNFIDDTIKKSYPDVLNFMVGLISLAKDPVKYFGGEALKKHKKWLDGQFKIHAKDIKNNFLKNVKTVNLNGATSTDVQLFYRYSKKNSKRFYKHLVSAFMAMILGDQQNFGYYKVTTTNAKPVLKGALSNLSGSFSSMVIQYQQAVKELQKEMETFYPNNPELNKWVKEFLKRFIQKTIDLIKVILPKLDEINIQFANVLILKNLYVDLYNNENIELFYEKSNQAFNNSIVSNDITNYHNIRNIAKLFDNKLNPKKT